jgi:hypothetical protein
MLEDLGRFGRHFAMRKSLSKVILLFFALFFASIPPSSAQSFDPDSLRQVITRGKKDSNTVNAYSALALS